MGLVQLGAFQGMMRVCLCSLHPGNVPLLDMGGITIISKTSFTNDEPYTTEALYYIRDGYRNLSSIKPFLDVDFNDPKVFY